jgi:hypothetical protein
MNAFKPPEVILAHKVIIEFVPASNLVPASIINNNSDKICHYNNDRSLEEVCTASSRNVVYIKHISDSRQRPA